MFYLNSMVRNSTGHGDDWYNLNTFILYLNSMVRSSTGHGDDWYNLNTFILYLNSMVRSSTGYGDDLHNLNIFLTAWLEAVQAMETIGMILLLGALVVLCIKLFCLKTKYFLRYVIIALLISAGKYIYRVCKYANNM
jgi:hypothetical protein